MSKTSWLREPYLRWPVRASAIAVIGPALVTLLAALPGTIPTEIAALLYIPAVVMAAAVGGPISGLGAALLSFQAMNYYFTDPLYTFGINNTDLVALSVFMAVAIAIGMLVAATISGRVRVEKKEMEARVLNQLATRLLSGEAVEEVLRRFARSLVDMFRLARCEIVTDVTQGSIIAAQNGSEPGSQGQVFTAPLVAKGRQIGKLEVEVDATRSPLDRDERDVMRAFAGQMALALEGMRLSDEVRGARLDAEANRLRATLFSSVTHDLRTPLSSITASVTSLLDGEDFSPSAKQEHLEMIRGEAERLNRLVANLLDMSRMRAGVLVPAKAPAAIEEVIESVLKRLRPQFGDRYVKLLFQDTLPEVPMDVVQIDQVITNLIENALKFSPPGSPLTISAHRWEGAVRVIVADSGPGIPKDEQDRLFEPFERGDGQHGPGTGLGLAIAKAIIVAHGGRIWVEDSPDAGLAVAFELLIK